MFDRAGLSMVLWFAAALIAMGAAAVDAAAQNSVEANGPVALEMEAPAHGANDSSSPPDVAKTSSSEMVGVSDIVGPPAPAAPPSEPPAIEHKRLGPAPVPMVARRPESEAPEPKVGGLIERLDPRTNEITKVGGALLVVVGMLFLARSLMRRASGLVSGGARPSGVLEILARYPIGRGQHFILLKMSRRVVLLHQSGSAMTCLSEVTEAEEVATLLGRLEAGANPREARKFKKVFTEFMAEHDSADRVPSRLAKSQLPPGDAELIDLTRNKSRGWRRLLGTKGGAG